MAHLDLGSREGRKHEHKAGLTIRTRPCASVVSPYAQTALRFDIIAVDASPRGCWSSVAALALAVKLWAGKEEALSTIIYRCMSAVACTHVNVC